MWEAARLREGVVPDWLAEVVRLHRAPVPWAAMTRAAMAICLPLAVAFAVGQRASGVLVAMGGLLGTVIDKGGPYAARVKRVGSAAVFGGAAGLAVGSFIHGRGWVAVAALVMVAGVSALLSPVSDIASITGLQLLIYTSISLGPLGAVRPWWHTAAGFVLGTVWALVLTVPAWLFSPRAAEQRSVAAVYHALAGLLRAAGAPGFAEMRRGVTEAFNASYDSLLAARSAAAGRNRRMNYLVALLNQANLVAEAATVLDREGSPPPQPVVETVDSAADAIRDGRHRAITVRPWGPNPGALALQEALVGVSRLIPGRVVPPAASPVPRRPIRERISAWRDGVGGRFTRTFALRLMACIGVAGVVGEVLPLTRSYWVVLTVAIVLKPDFGSVFARAVQRGIGTIVGAVLGAVILAAVPYGPWLLIPFGVLAALLPYAQARSYGLFATFITPLVVLLIDLLSPVGWHIALDRLLDTLLGCGIVLLIGYAPWPMSWQAHLPGQFARTVRQVSQYMQEALVTAWARPPGDVTTSADGATASAADAPPAGAGATAEPEYLAAKGLPPRSQLRRQAYRALSDLRAEFQRTMSEPATVRRRAAAWWPALVGLEEVMDAVTATAVAISCGAPSPSPDGVRQLSTTLGAVAATVEGGAGRPEAAELPADAPLMPVTEAVRSVLTVLATGKPTALAGS
jgi:uncharacterized membrane protein YccC